MKALVYTGVKTLEIRETPAPVTGDDDVRIKVMRLGSVVRICTPGPVTTNAGQRL